MILAINPGSTSTKIALFDDAHLLFSRTIRHSNEELKPFDTIVSQQAYRTSLVLDLLDQEGIDSAQIDIYIAIAGLIRPGKAGVYEVNADMLRDLKDARYNEHASNLGAIIACELASKYGKPAYAADAITADELADVARLSGMPEITRSGRSHTLNQKYTARKASAELGLNYNKAKLIVVHLGGGISVTAHLNGLMTDTNAARGEGPFCIDRTGGLNSFELAKLCYSNKYSAKEMFSKINGNGGVVAYLGTRDFREVENRCAAGDELAIAVTKAMAYQVSKEIASMLIPLGGKADAIVLTGGMARSKYFTDMITAYTEKLADIMIYPGEGEMEALAQYALDIKSGNLQPMKYESEFSDV